MNTNILAVAAIAAVALSSGASAAPYVGMAAGPTHYSVDCSGTLTCDSNDTGFKVFAGFKFTPNWAAELNYFDFGKAKATVDDGSGGTAAMSINSTAMGLGVAFFAPMSSNWNFVARLGAARVKTKIDVSVFGSSGSDSDTHTKPYYGLGVSYLVPLAARTLSIDFGIDITKAEYSKVLQGQDVSGKGNVRLISIGVSYPF